MAKIYTNQKAKSWTYSYSTDISLPQSFHQRLPGYQPTPLTSLDNLAQELRVRAVFAKDESSRLGLPAFKILGASWGTFRAIASKIDLPLDSTIAQMSEAARELGVTLFAATEGNHGRAVAHMAKILSISARIFVGRFTDVQVQEKIASEGATVHVVQGTYDEAVAEADFQSRQVRAGILVQDNAFDGYEDIPAWIVEGYSTLLREVDQQLADQSLKATILVTPIGVGSLGHAVVAHCKSDGRAITVLAVEPQTSACLHHNLRDGRLYTIDTSKTIMDGMNCGTVSPISWPVLKEGVDVSVTISDQECHESIEYLHQHGVNAGPCGAGPLAGLKKVTATDPGALGLNKNSVVVLLSTEGTRYYAVP